MARINCGHNGCADVCDYCYRNYVKICEHDIVCARCKVFRDERVHELKTWGEPFQAMWCGQKRHEIRVNDRDFRVGDVLYLRLYDPESNYYPGASVLRRVTHITPGGAFGLPSNLCVMSIEHIDDVYDAPHHITHMVLAK